MGTMLMDNQEDEFDGGTMMIAHEDESDNDHFDDSTMLFDENVIDANSDQYAQYMLQKKQEDEDKQKRKEQRQRQATYENYTKPQNAQPNGVPNGYQKGKKGSG